jgi:membrane associated rhomboid family serine protease
MPIVTYLLIGINVLVFALSTVDPGYKYRLMKVNSLISRGQLYRLGTALFLHSSLGHIFNNMSSLWQLGPMVSVFLISLLCHLIREHICT